MMVKLHPLLIVAFGAALTVATPQLVLAQNMSLPASPGAPATDKKAHRLILQVNTNEPGAMNLALNNATNVEQHYKRLGATIQIEIVTFGPGLNMLREDTSPVKDRIRALAETSRSITFSACDNTRANMSRAEQKEIPLISQATIVSSGVVRVIELQEQGWSYVRP